jgi:hypothetical protein
LFNFDAQVNPTLFSLQNLTCKISWNQTQNLNLTNPKRAKQPIRTQQAQDGCLFVFLKDDTFYQKNSSQLIWPNFANHSNL